MAISHSKKFTVTQKHIDEAQQGNSAKCMVAEALKDSAKGNKHPHADIQTLRYTDKDGIRRTWLTPAAVQVALVRFDAGDPVQPFSFFLKSPLHISRRPVQGGRLPVGRSDRGERATPPNARVGGKPVVIGNRTRRLFGIRKLRINQQGQVEQIRVEEAD